MSEVKDPKIKLFGKTIELPETAEAAAICEEAKQNNSNQNPICSSDDYVHEDSSSNGSAKDQESQLFSLPSLPHEHMFPQSRPDPKQDDAKDGNQPRPSPSNEKEPNAPPPSAGVSREDPTESSNSQDKTLKKPDKVLPCPRCNSMDTKFCYFNNYNVNQPRHFCKNCQRYWTAGGTMRNVAVGAGRRKNKNVLASQFHHVAVPEGAPVNPNGTLLAFNSDASLCESMVSIFNISDQTIRSEESNGDDCWRGSPVSGSKDEVPIFRGATWPYQWQNPIQCSPISPPTFALPSFPVPFYSTTPTYWAGPSIWNGPFVISPTSASSSGPKSPLGKHSRDENISKPANLEDAEIQKESNNPEKCLLVPKTLKIDDQGEAAKSSFIRSTLGMKNGIRDDDCVGIGKSGLFKACQGQQKDDEKTPVQKTSTLLQANPSHCPAP